MSWLGHSAFARLGLLLGGDAFKLEPIPRFHVSELSVEDFDTRFLSNEPVILTGASACPAGVSFDDQKKYCWGKISPHVKVKMDSNESRWAGLKEANADPNLEMADFIESMGNGSNPRYAFDVNLPAFCPGLVGKIHLPAQLTTIFQAQWSESHMWDFDYRKCLQLPSCNSYLAEAGFESDIHIDIGHTSFIASMCEGQKRWRIFTARNMSFWKDDFSEEVFSQRKTLNGTERSKRGVYPKIHLRSPFDTWSSASPLHDKEGLVVFEGVLSPGEIIYIPGGAPHAAITMSKSWMVASNDHTLEEAADVLEVCSRLRDHSDYKAFCRFHEATLQRSLQNYQLYKHTMPRASTSFLASHGCSRVDIDHVTDGYGNADELVHVTPDNLYDLLAEGPLMLVKLQRGNQYWSSALRPRLPLIPSRFTPRLRVGIVCDGDCVHSPTNTSMFKSEERDATVLQHGSLAWEAIMEMNSVTPEVLIVKACNGGIVRHGKSLNFTIDYMIGCMTYDNVLTWASMITGHEVSGLDLKWKLVYWAYNFAYWLLSKMIITCGFKAHTNGPFQLAPGVTVPDGGTIGATASCTVIIVVFFFLNYRVRRWKLSSRRESAAPAWPPGEPKVGTRVVVNSKNLGSSAGTVRYLGQLRDERDLFVGVELDEPKTNNDGSLKGVRYFTCASQHGLFAKPAMLSPLNTDSSKTKHD